MRKPGPEYLSEKYEPFRSQQEIEEGRKGLASLPIGISEMPLPTQSGEYKLPSLTFELTLEDVNPSEYLFNRSSEEIARLEQAQNLDQQTKDALSVRKRLGVDSPEKVKIVRGFTANFEDGASFNLSDVIPEGWRVLYVPSSSEVTRGGANMDLKMVIVNGNLLGFEGITALTHECAHYATLKTLSEEEHDRYELALKRVVEARRNLNKAEEVTAEDLKLVYHAERSAWAETLLKLKPFLRHYDQVTGEHSADALQRAIHEFALSKDTNSLRMLDPGIRELFKNARDPFDW